VRRVFASAASAPAYSYDPYGNALQGTAPLTDFNYAGMFYNADSGLYLTRYRAYDPVPGRWLSRDPIEETIHRIDLTMRYFSIGTGMPVALRIVSDWTERIAESFRLEDGINSFATGNNLYTYVGDAPIYRTDTSGLSEGPAPEPSSPPTSSPGPSTPAPAPENPSSPEEPEPLIPRLLRKIFPTLRRRALHQRAAPAVSAEVKAEKGVTSVHN
jgi:RHS repeat-associated protein